jgi:hypothetical protein
MKRTFLSASVLGLVVIACSDPPPPTSRAVIESTVNAGSHSQKDCGISGLQWLSMGGFGNPSTGTLPRPVENNSSEGGGTAVINCSVKKSGDKYDVAASAQITGGSGGTIAITGRFTESGEQTPIRGVFTRGDFGRFEQVNCKVTYGDAPQGVAAGRIWGNLACPDIKATDGRVCNAEVQFRFENCAQ